MNRQGYLDLAAAGLRMPIAAHLVLHARPDAEAVPLDGRRLGEVLVETARRYRTPLAVPLMDLAIEKELLLWALGVEPAAIPTHHFHAPPPPAATERLDERLRRDLTPRMRASLDAIRHVSRESDLVPLGMCIGPFSLMTKLLDDPITPVFLAGEGEDGPEADLARRLLELATRTVLASAALQMAAGACGVFVCEPAANAVYVSPKQMDAGSDVFERFVMEPNRRLRAAMAGWGAELILHDCGELTGAMVRALASLDPAILSLGSSRRLWEDAALVGPRTVLYGNLPSKRFYSDTELPAERVRLDAEDLERRMRATGHPFILGTECDVLSVPGCEARIRGKVDAMMNCGACGA